MPQPHRVYGYPDEATLADADTIANDEATFEVNTEPVEIGKLKYTIMLTICSNGILLNCTAFVLVHFKHKEMFPCCFHSLKMEGWCMAMPVYRFNCVSSPYMACKQG